MIDEWKYITESKKVGILYHFTKVEHFRLLSTLEKFLGDIQCEMFEFVSLNGHLSTTRSFSINSIPYFKLNTETHPIRIAFDGDKISQKFKIKPINGLGSNDREIFGLNLNHERVPHKSETEEVICPLKNQKSFKMLKYVVEVQINHYIVGLEKSKKLKQDLEELFKKNNLKIEVTSVRGWIPFKGEINDELKECYAEYDSKCLNYYIEGEL